MQYLIAFTLHTSIRKIAGLASTKHDCWCNIPAKVFLKISSDFVKLLTSVDFLIVHFESSILQPTMVNIDTWYTLYRLPVKLTERAKPI